MASIITDKGLRILNRALEPIETFVPKYIIITDNATTPSETDTLAIFCDRNVDNYTLSEIINYDSDFEKAIFIAQIGSTEGNYTWTKVGLIDENEVLIAQKAYPYTKSSGKKTVKFDLGVTR